MFPFYCSDNNQGILLIDDDAFEMIYKYTPPRHHLIYNFPYPKYKVFWEASHFH